ncbi:thyroid receptor-interacting protein 11-like, partial [Diaphorina citri]|uniref:Thyroid receptor-interacting protein 11-like n=1 Tax=Diaphorina citri TaxID=121845 RepID=A0A3Q0JJJ1_DIACI
NERLKQHLLKTEEDNTSDLVKAEQTIQDLHVKLREAEERVKSSATAYTSASVRSNQQVCVRSNQQVEALTSQVKSLTEQKEKLQEKLYQAEDVVQKHQASLTNLQIVLEQFQAGKYHPHCGGLSDLNREQTIV